MDQRRPQLRGITCCTILYRMIQRCNSAGNSILPLVYPTSVAYTTFLKSPEGAKTWGKDKWAVKPSHFNHILCMYTYYIGIFNIVHEYNILCSRNVGWKVMITHMTWGEKWKRSLRTRRVSLDYYNTHFFFL